MSTDTPDSPNRPPLSVSALVAAARGALERGLGAVRVAGEISNFTRAASGHCYFNLKDAGAQVRCVLWRTRARLIDFPLRDGLAVEIDGGATMYEPRGEFQIAVDSVREAGAGALYERFMRLKARLEAQGLFAIERKRALPAYPQCVGIVTSLAAAALHDVLTTLRRRAPGLRVVIYPTAVQGATAASDIAAAIRAANARHEVEALIVCRGGGSLEDLWAFNEEIVARAAFESTLPIISGVGHETDVTILDFVADLRAPTPTGAATLLTPDRAELIARIAAWRARLARALTHGLAARTQRVDVAARLLIHPAARLTAQRARLAEAARRMAAAQSRHVAAHATLLHALMRRLCREWRRPPAGRARVTEARARWQRAGTTQAALLTRRLATLEQNLAHLSPQAVLTRGYAIVTASDGEIVTDGKTLAAGETVAISFAQGQREATIR